MGYLRSIASQVESIYKDSHETFSSFQQEQNLNCLTGCGKCCLGKEINATIVELLPTAYKLYDAKVAEEILEKIEKLNSEHEIIQCIFYEKHSPDGVLGKCTNYDTRPSVCRSFGAAATKNKEGKKVAAVCKLIKEHRPEEYKNANFENAPVMGDFARKIMSIDSVMGRELIPINQALRFALEKVLFTEEYEEGAPKRF